MARWLWVAWLCMTTAGVFALAPTPSSTGRGASDSPFALREMRADTQDGAERTEAKQSALRLGVGIVFQAERFVDQIAHLKAIGVPAVLVRLEWLPNREHWQMLVDTLESSGMEWWLCLEGLPRCDGWLCAPDQFRLQGNSEGVYSVQLPPDTPHTLLALSPADSPHLQALYQLNLGAGRAVFAQSDTDQSVLLLYPYLRKVMPDLWEGWNRYRDRLFAILKARPPKQGFKGWLIASEWTSLSLAVFPESQLARAEWQAFLKTRYPEIVDLENAWNISGAFKDHAHASELIPLWRGLRGLPFLVSPKDPNITFEVETRRSRFWNDYQHFLATRWQSLVNALQTALHAHTPDAQLLVLHKPSESELEPFPQGVQNALFLPRSSLAHWQTSLVLSAFQATRGAQRLSLVCIEGADLTPERATLVQRTARELGIPLLFWQMPAEPALSHEWWQTVQQNDTPPETPQFIPFPRALWGLTSIQKFRTGWWIPLDPAEGYNLLAWGFEIGGFWRVVEVQQLDREGNLVATPQVELYLWSVEGEQEIVLRRLDRNPLSAIDLNGQEVRLNVRGDTVRFTLGTTPIRIRGFAMLPYCESAIEHWSQRVQELFKRTGSQLPEALKFRWENAQTVYRRDREQGFAQIRSAWLEIERAYQPYRWLEVENATVRTVGMARPDPALSGGASWVVDTLLPPPEFLVRYKVRLRVAGAHTLWLSLRIPPSGNGGTVEWQLVRETESEQTPVQGTAELKEERAVARYADQFAWIPLGSFSAQPGDYLLTLRWIPENKNPPYSAEWDALLIAPAGITPRTILPPPF